MTSVLIVPIGEQLETQLVTRLMQIVGDEHNDATIAYERSVWPTSARNHAIRHWQQERGEDWLLLLSPDVIPPRGILDMTRHDRSLVSANVPWFRSHESTPIPVPAAFELVDIGTYRTIRNPFGRSGLMDCALVLPLCLLIRRDAVMIEQPFVESTTRIDGHREIVDSIPLCAAVTPAIDFDHVCDHMQRVSLQRLHQGYTGMFLSLSAAQHAQARPQQLIVTP